MRSSLSLLIAALALVLGLLPGCSRDPNVQKQRHLASGKRYAEQGKHREAVIEFLNAIKLDPNLVEAHYRLALEAWKLGDISATLMELQRVVLLNPNHLDAQAAIGKVEVAAGNTKTAKEKADFVLARNPDHVEGLLLRAKLLVSSGQYRAAFQPLHKVISLEPKRVEAHAMKADVQLLTGEVAAAEMSYKEALALSPKNEAVLLGLSDICQRTGRMAEAEQYLRQADANAGQSMQPRAALILFYLAQRQPDKAEQLAVEAKKSRPKEPNAYRLPGNFYIQAGQWDRALEEFRSLAKEHGNDLGVKRTYTQLLILRDHLDEATAANEEMLRLSGNDPEALTQRGQILIRRGKPREAAEALRTALRSTQDFAAAHYYLGVALNMMADSSGAQREWREAARLRPGRLEPQLALASQALAKNDASLLNQASQRMMQAQPNSASGYVMRAVASFARGRRQDGENDLRKATEVEPRNPLGFVCLGEYRLSQHDYATAETSLEHALELDPNYLDALKDLVRMYLEQKQMEKAKARVALQITKAPNNSMQHVMLSALRAEGKDFAGAEAGLQKAIELDKKNSEAYLLLGRVQMARGDPGRAMVTYQQWSKERPYDDRSLFLLGGLHDQRGEWQQAQQYYRQALSINPDNALAANNLSFSLLEHGGDVEIALSQALAARTAIPNSAETADTLGWAYYHKGEYAKAVRVLQQAIRDHPHSAAIHYHLGLSYQKLNQGEQAKTHLRKVLELDSNYVHADRVRTALQQLH